MGFQSLRWCTGTCTMPMWRDVLRHLSRTMLLPSAHIMYVVLVAFARVGPPCVLTRCGARTGIRARKLSVFVRELSLAICFLSECVVVKADRERGTICAASTS